MPDTVLSGQTVTITGGVRKSRETSRVVNLTHNNQRLLSYEGRHYEFVGTDAQGRRIYRDHTRHT